VVLALVVAAYVMNPVKEGEDHVFEPVARELNLVDGKCPDGWSYNYITDHGLAETCWRKDWSVTLYPNGVKKANYGINTRAGEGAPPTDCKDIPDWPDSWCYDQQLSEQQP
jgi:hypothetical protein